MKRYLIIGGGAAGLEAAKTLRAADADSHITIVTAESSAPYSRPKLIYFLSGNDAPESLATYGPDWYRTNHIEMICGHRVRSLDTKGGSAVDDAGRVYGWDRLLLACGGSSLVPAVLGVQRPGVFELRSLDDALKVREYAEGRKSAVVIGGGLLGLESAYSLSTRGLEVTVVELAPWLLPRQLDKTGGEHLQRLLEEKGLRFILGDQIAALEGGGTGGPVERVALKSGSSLKTEMALLSIGVRPETSLAAESGILVNRGIVVGDKLETSAPNVYAAGDAAEHRGVCYGLWTVALEQGRIAGLNMADGNTVYPGSLPSSQLKITGIDLYSSGDVRLSETLGTDAPTFIVYDESERYRKMLIGPDGKPLFAIVLNDRPAIQIARKIMSGAASPDAFR